jgi:FkbM family methyltransferase
MFGLTDKIRKNILVSSDHGLMLVNRFDYNENLVGQGRCILDHGNMSTVEAANCIDSISDSVEPIIFDIGANIGTLSTWLARYFTKGKIYCFEPQREVFKILCANLAMNNLDNTYPYNIAFGKTDEFKKIKEPDYLTPNDFGTYSLVNENIKSSFFNEITIEIKTLDTFIEQYAIPKLNLLKIDAEGMDLDVLQGAQKTIEKFNPVILIEHFDNLRSIQAELESFFSCNHYKTQIVNNNILAFK